MIQMTFKSVCAATFLDLKLCRNCSLKPGTEGGGRMMQFPLFP